MKLFTYVSRKTLVIYILALVSCVATLCILPIVPAHIQMTLQPDGAQRPSWFLIITSLLPILATVLFSCVPYEDEQGDARQRPFYYQALMWLFALVLLTYHWLVIVNTLGFSITGEMVAQLGLALLMVAIGIYLRPLPFKHPGTAIKLVWVMEDETVWCKTHRKAGIAFILVGIVTIISVVLVHLPFWKLSPSLPTIVLIVTLLIAGLTILWSSMRCYKKLHKDDTAPTAKTTDTPDR